MNRNQHMVLVRSITRGKDPEEFKNGWEHIKSCPYCLNTLNYWHRLLTDAKRTLIAGVKENPNLRARITIPPIFQKKEGIWWDRETGQVCCQLFLAQLEGQRVYFYLEGEGNDLLESGIVPWKTFKFKPFVVYGNGWIDFLIGETTFWTLAALIKIWKEQNKINIVVTTKEPRGDD